MNSRFHYFFKARNWRGFASEAAFYLQMRLAGRPHQNTRGKIRGRRWGFWNYQQVVSAWAKYDTVPGDDLLLQLLV